MPRSSRRFAALALLFATCCGPVLAASSGATSVSESIGMSIGSISGSLKNSSGSSSRGADVAEGDYEVLDIAAVEGGAPADRVTMTLRALPGPGRGGAGDLVLELPRLALDEGRVARGGVVTARQRPYGAEFANRATGRAFFLVLDDEWYRELRANALPS